jgi:chemotaxis protein CheZ
MAIQTAETMKTQLHFARRLVQSLEVGDQEAANRLVERLIAEHESALFNEVGRLTRELHEALRRVPNDARLSSLADHEIPDAMERLGYVVAKTEAAAHRTIEAVEQLLPIAADVGAAAEDLAAQTARRRRGTLDVTEEAALDARIDAFLDSLRERATRLKSGLGEVLLAQDFQDLTGQVIRRIMTLVQEVEDNLVGVIRRAGGGEDDAGSRGPGANAATGPAATRQACGQAVKGQDDVDAILSSLGF